MHLTQAWRSALMANALDFQIERSGSSPGKGTAVVSVGKTLYAHSVSLHPGEFNARGGGGIEPCDGLASIQGGVGLVPAWWATWLECRLNLPNTGHHLTALFK